MASVVWSEKALNHVESIALFISLDSELYAKKVTQHLFSLADSLELFPERGRIVPEFDSPNLREIIYGNYRLVYYYETSSDTVEIVQVFHSSRVMKQ